MADSEWESIRKKTRNRIRFGVGIGIPVVLLAGFLYYNNRDLFSSSVQAVDAVGDSVTTLVKSSPDSTVGRAEYQNRRVDVQPVDSLVKNTDSVAVRIAPEIKKTAKNGAVEKMPDSKQEVIEIPVAATISGSFLELSSIRCRTADQNGLILNLSVELKSAHGAIEKKILIMRNELRVVIQNIVRSKEATTLKQEPLKTEIIQSVNKYIGKEVFNDLKFTEFKVEKVIKK